MDDLEWRESLKEGDLVVVKRLGVSWDMYFEGVVAKRTPKRVKVSSDRYFGTIEFQIDTGVAMGTDSKYSIVPPDDEKAMRYLLTGKIESAIRQGALKMLPVETLEELANILG